MQYRQQALARIQAGDELGNPLRLTTPRTWVVMVLLVLVVVAGGVWAAVGSLPRKVTAPGVLSHPQGVHAVYNTAGGQVSEVLVQPGTDLAAGATVASLTNGVTTTAVRAVTPGRVTEVLVAVGQYAPAGAPLARVEPVGSGDNRPVAILYATAADGASIRSGADVELSAQYAPAAGGRLHGTVTSVDRIPQTKAQISQFLGDDDELAERFVGQGLPLKVVVSLARPPGTANRGGASAGGGSGSLSSRTLVVGVVHLPDLRPVDWLLPRGGR